MPGSILGTEVRRVEDRELLLGEGTFVDNLDSLGVAHAVFVRSPFAHARITGIDTAEAQKADGVLGVFTADDLGREGLASFANVNELHATIDDPALDIGPRMLGDLSELEDILVRQPVDEVLITLPVKSCYAQIQDAIEICGRIGVECKYLSDIFQPSFAQEGYEELRGFNVITLKPVVPDARFIIKRGFDIVASSLGLTLLSPLFLIIAIAIKVSSSGPAIFSQERHGRNRRRFRMYKFRTMVDKAEALQPSLELKNEVCGPVFKIRNDPRVTSLGMFLRRSSLDELPQLLNVLKGEMSLVGPRPLPGRDVSKFEEAWLLRRFCVVPGLTGLWQVTARNSIRFEDWVQRDFEYIDNWSLKLDFLILARTIPAVLKGVGAV